MSKSKSKGGIQVSEAGAGETVWTQVATVAVKRGVNGRGEPPMMLRQQVASGELPNGRKFDVSVNLGSGGLVVMLDSHEGDKSRAYIVDPREVIEALLAAEFPG